MKKLILFGILILFFIGNFASATVTLLSPTNGTPYTGRFFNATIDISTIRPHNLSLTQFFSGAGGANYEAGVTIFMNQTLNLTKINIAGFPAPPTFIYIRNLSGDLYRVTNGTGNFTVPVRLQQGNFYRITLSWSGIGAYINATDLTTRVQSNGFTWINGSEGEAGAIDNSTRFSNVVSLEAYNLSEIPLVNTTLYIWNNSGSVVYRNATTASGIRGSPNITLPFGGIPFLNNYRWNILACRNASVPYCEFQSSNFSFLYGLDVNNQSYNTSSYETSSESFNLNITIYNSSIDSGLFVYNNVSYQATVTQIGGGNYTLERTIDIPTEISQGLWYFILSLSDSTNLTLPTSQQNVSSINLSICGASPFTVPYVNFSFKNETSLLQSVNATISSSWTYYLGSGSVNKTYSFSNTTETSRYTFCFSPTHKNVIVDASIAYANSESPQRTFGLQQTSLTNSTTNYILYLLPSSLGIYTRYQTINTVGTSIPGVFAQVTKLISGTPTIMASGLTDSSGLIAFFLNPEETYSYSFSKSGFETETFSLMPNSLDTYFVTMGGGGTGITNGTQISQNLSYYFLPSNLSLQNGTNYTFVFGVNSSRTLTTVSLNLTNSSGSQLAFLNRLGQGNVSTSLNTGNNTFIYGYASVSDGTETFTIVHIWQVNNDFIGDYSINRQLGLFSQYSFSAFTRIVLFLILLIGIMIFVSRNETLDTSESKIMIVILVTWMASYFHFLDIGLTVTASGTIGTLAENASQYGIAIVTSAAGLGLIFRRMWT